MVGNTDAKDSAKHSLINSRSDTPPTVANNLDALGYTPSSDEPRGSDQPQSVIIPEDHKQSKDPQNSAVASIKNFVIANSSSIEFGAYAIFSLGVSGCYGVLAYPRGNDNHALCRFYLVDSALVNLPQYIMMPYRLKENVKAAWYSRDIFRGLLSLAAGTGTLIASFPLSETAADTLATIIGKQPSLSTSVPVLGLFSSAIAVTRLSGVLAVSRMAQNTIRNVYFNYVVKNNIAISSESILRQEYNRYAIGLLEKDLKANIDKCPSNLQFNEINNDWITTFYNSLSKENFPVGKKQCSADLLKKGVEYTAISVLIASFIATVPMWLALAKEGTKSNSEVVNFLASLANLAFGLWFCVIFPQDLARSTKLLYQFFNEKIDHKTCVSGLLTFLVQSVLLGFCFISGFGYFQVGMSEYRKDFDGMVNGTFWEPLDDVVNILHNGNVYGEDLALQSGVVANMGAICRLMRDMLEKRQENLRLQQAETDEERAQIKYQQTCLKRLSEYTVAHDMGFNIICKRNEAIERDQPVHNSEADNSGLESGVNAEGSNRASPFLNDDGQVSNYSGRRSPGAFFSRNGSRRSSQLDDTRDDDQNLAGVSVVNVSSSEGQSNQAEQGSGIANWLYNSVTGIIPFFSRGGNQTNEQSALIQNDNALNYSAGQ